MGNAPEPGPQGSFEGRVESLWITRLDDILVIDFSRTDWNFDLSEIYGLSLKKATTWVHVIVLFRYVQNKSISPWLLDCHYRALNATCHADAHHPPWLDVPTSLQSSHHLRTRCSSVSSMENGQAHDPPAAVSSHHRSSSRFPYHVRGSPPNFQLDLTSGKQSKVLQRVLCVILSLLANGYSLPFLPYAPKKLLLTRTWRSCLFKRVKRKEQDLNPSWKQLCQLPTIASRAVGLQSLDPWHLSSRWRARGFGPESLGSPSQGNFRVEQMILGRRHLTPKTFRCRISL